MYYSPINRLPNVFTSSWIWTNISRFYKIIVWHNGWVKGNHNLYSQVYISTVMKNTHFCFRCAWLNITLIKIDNLNNFIKFLLYKNPWILHGDSCTTFNIFFALPCNRSFIPEIMLTPLMSRVHQARTDWHIIFFPRWNKNCQRRL